MKFNLKSIVLPLSIIASTNNNCINAMEEQDINTSSNVINENSNIITNEINTNTSIKNQEYVNITDLDKDNLENIQTCILKCNNYDKMYNPLVSMSFEQIDNDFGENLFIRNGFGNNFNDMIQSFNSFNSDKLKLSSKQIIFIRYLVTIARVLNKSLSNYSSFRIPRPDTEMYSIKGINNVINMDILDPNLKELFNEEKENDDYNISFKNLFSVIESLMKVQLPLQIQVQNNNTQYLITKSQYNDLFQCIMRHTISEFFIKISKLYNNEKNDNMEEFTEKFENMHKTMQNSCYKFRLQFDNSKRKLNEYAYSDNKLDNAEKFVTKFINNLDNKQNEFEYVRELISKYSNKFMNKSKYYQKYVNYKTTGLYNLINIPDFQNEIKNEMKKEFNKIKLNVYNVSSLLNYIYKQRGAQLPSNIYYNIAEFVGTKNNPDFTYILTCDCRNNKKYNIVIVDIAKNKVNNIKTDYSNSNIKTEKVTEKIYNYKQPIVKINYKGKQDHHKEW